MKGILSDGKVTLKGIFSDLYNTYGTESNSIDILDTRSHVALVKVARYGMDDLGIDLGGFIRVLINVWLNYSAVMINHSSTNLTTIKQIIGSMLLASSHLNTNIYIFVGGFSNIVSYLTSTLDV